MNFHKTIGFLASLLLMVGLGAPDSFAQNPAGTMTVEFTDSRVDGIAAGAAGASDSVRVKVTLNPAPDAATTVSVGLTINPATTGLEITDDSAAGTITPITNVDVVVRPNGMGTSSGILVVDTTTDYIDTATLVATGTALTGIQVGTATYDYAAFAASIPVRSMHRIPASTRSITLEADSAVPSLDGSGVDQTVTVTVTLAQAPGQNAADDPITVSVNFVATHVAPNGSETSFTAPTAVAIEDDEKTGTATLTVPSANAVVGTIRLVAGATGYRSDMIEIPVINRDAEDIQGFRVVIASPGNKDWVGIDEEVEVHVMRVSRHAYDWTQFTSIAVSLRDTMDSGGVAHTLLSATQNEAGTSIVSAMTVTNFNAASDGTIETNDEDVMYDRATDKFVFTFKLGEDDKETPTAANYKGVYAAVTFAAASISDTVDPPVNIINSNDAKTNVFASASLLAGVPQANRKVGDGNLIQVDVVRPTDSAEFGTDDLTVTVDGDPADRNTMVKIGQKIEVELAVSGTVRFRDGNIRLAIATSDAPGNHDAKNKTFASATFDADDIADASDGSLDISLNVAAGTFKVNPSSNNTIRNRDTGKYLKANQTFEVDGLSLVAKVNTIDQAGNVSATGVSSAVFKGDSRKPVISVIHPAASGDYFSAIYENTRDLEEFDDLLKPLVVRVDEDDLKELYIFAPGSGRVENRDKVDLTDTSISNVIGQAAAANTVGDTTAYNTTALKYPNPDENNRAKLIGGKAITLRVVAIDAAGNKTVKDISNVTHDENPPALMTWFPKHSLLEEEDDGTYLINNATRHPTLTLPEAVDSIAVTYSSRGETPIVEEVGGTTAKGDREVPITDAFGDGRTYTLTIFTRDLAGNVAISGGEELKFSASFANPMANAFKVTNMTGNTDPKKASAGVIAGQAFVLEIQAIDDSGDDDRNVYTYKNDMASAVKISAWAGDGVAESVSFSGGGVTDDAANPGYASLNAAGWSNGKRTVHVKSEKALDDITILIQHLDAADAEVFNGSIGDLYVDAADFAGFSLTAMQNGIEVTELNPGAFDLEVVPADKYGNRSTKAFAKDPEMDLTTADSLALLDSAVAKNNATHVEFDTIPIEFDFRTSLFDSRSTDLVISQDGDTLPLEAPASGTVRITIAILDDDLDPSNGRTAAIKTQRKNFPIVAPLMPRLTLWVPGVDGDQAGNDVEIPKDADDITVTVNAEGYKAGSLVTFTKNGTAMDAEAANDDGTASLMIIMSAAGTVTVSATDGRYRAPETGDLSITFTEEPDEPTRMVFNTEADGSGDPVYLINLTDNTVGLDDYELFRAAWGKMKGDDINGDGTADDADVQIFLQSDIVPVDAPDGEVNLDDYEEFITSWNKIAANGPASKPIVLLPGINENAEFSLSLGSERVVAGELVAVDVSLANVEALVSYGFTLNYETDKFEFVSVAPADEDLLKSTGGEIPMFFHHLVADGQVEVANGLVNGTAVSGGGDIVRFVFRVLREFEDNARFEIANGLVFDPTNLSNPAVVAGVLELQSTPREFALHQNFPNPFNPDTTIKYDLAESADVTLQIYNVLGQVVRTLVASEAQNAGRYQIRWNGMDDRGVPVSSGVYFYQISAEGKFHQVQKLMLLK